MDEGVLYVPGEYCYPAEGEPVRQESHPAELRRANGANIRRGIEAAGPGHPSVRPNRHEVLRTVPRSKHSPTAQAIRITRPAAAFSRLMIVDRYLLRQFVQTLLDLLLQPEGLYIVIDGFAQPRGVHQLRPETGRPAGGDGRVLRLSLAVVLRQHEHMLTLIAAMFTVTWIQRHNELTALEAAGIPKAASHSAGDRGRGRDQPGQRSPIASS